MKRNRFKKRISIRNCKRFKRIGKSNKKNSRKTSKSIGSNSDPIRESLLKQLIIDGKRMSKIMTKSLKTNKKLDVKYLYVKKTKY
jgi:hypothetical protein